MIDNPGPELDRHIGEVLGFEIISEKEDVQRRQQTEHERGTIILYGSRFILRRKGLDAINWAPSTSWESMQLVVEEMQRRGVWIEIAWNPDKAHWRCLIGANKVEGIKGVDLNASTAPFAVCMAALKALEDKQ